MEEKDHRRRRKKMTVMMMTTTTTTSSSNKKMEEEEEEEKQQQRTTLLKNGALLKKTCFSILATVFVTMSGDGDGNVFLFAREFCGVFKVLVRKRVHVQLPRRKLHRKHREFGVLLGRGNEESDVKIKGER